MEKLKFIGPSYNRSPDLVKYS